MSYMNSEKKALLMPKIKEICKKYHIKGSVSVRHYSTLVLTIYEGDIDFLNLCHKRYPYRITACQVNPYGIQESWDSPAKECLLELVAAMNNGNHDNSDVQRDHFDVGWYVDIKIGTHEKPYIYSTKEAQNE